MRKRMVRNGQDLGGLNMKSFAPWLPLHRRDSGTSVFRRSLVDAAVTCHEGYRFRNRTLITGTQESPDIAMNGIAPVESVAGPALNNLPAPEVPTYWSSRSLPAESADKACSTDWA